MRDCQKHRVINGTAMHQTAIYECIYVCVGVVALFVVVVVVPKGDNETITR